MMNIKVVYVANGIVAEQHHSDVFGVIVDDLGTLNVLNHSRVTIAGYSKHSWTTWFRV